MNNGFYNDNDDRLLEVGDEDKKDLDNETVAEESEEYYNLPLAIKSRSLIWSVVSFTFGVLSLALCAFYYVSLPFAVAAVVFSLVSRRNLSFFEKYSIMGLIFGLMGIVFSIFSLVANTLGII